MLAVSQSAYPRLKGTLFGRVSSRLIGVRRSRPFLSRHQTAALRQRKKYTYSSNVVQFRAATDLQIVDPDSYYHEEQTLPAIYSSAVSKAVANDFDYSYMPSEGIENGYHDHDIRFVEEMAFGKKEAVDTALSLIETLELRYLVKAQERLERTNRIETAKLLRETAQALFEGQGKEIKLFFIVHNTAKQRLKLLLVLRALLRFLA